MASGSSWEESISAGVAVDDGLVHKMVPTEDGFEDVVDMPSSGNYLPTILRGTSMYVGLHLYCECFVTECRASAETTALNIITSVPHGRSGDDIACLLAEGVRAIDRREVAVPDPQQGQIIRGSRSAALHTSQPRITSTTTCNETTHTQITPVQLTSQDYLLAHLIDIRHAMQPCSRVFAFDIDWSGA